MPDYMVRNSHFGKWAIFTILKMVSRSFKNGKWVSRRSPALGLTHNVPSPWLACTCVENLSHTMCSSPYFFFVFFWLSFYVSLIIYLVVTTKNWQWITKNGVQHISTYQKSETKNRPTYHFTILQNVIRYAATFWILVSGNICVNQVCPEP